MKKFYVVSAEIIESNFPDDLEKMLPDMTIIYMNDESDNIKESMGYYLSDDEEDYNRIIEALRYELINNPSEMIDDVEYVESDGISITPINVWEKVQRKFTVKEFCDLVGIK